MLLFIPAVLAQRARTIQTFQLTQYKQFAHMGPLSPTQRAQWFYYLWAHVLKRPVAPDQQLLTQADFASLPATVQRALCQLSIHYPYIVCISDNASRRRNRRTGEDVVRAIVFPFRLWAP